jgi:hypothetical protein
MSTPIYFRFQDLPEYNTIKGGGIKECDFAFYENGQIYIVELCHFKFNQKTGFNKDREIEEYRLKLSNNLLLLTSIWSNLPFMKRCNIPEPFLSPKQVEIIFGFEFEPVLAPFRTFLETELIENTRGYLRLMSQKPGKHLRATATFLTFKGLQENYPAFGAFAIAQEYPDSGRV